MLQRYYLHTSKTEWVRTNMNGQHKNSLMIGIASLIIGTAIGVLATNEKHRESVLNAVNKGYVAIKGFVKPEE